MIIIRELGSCPLPPLPRHPACPAPLVAAPPPRTNATATRPILRRTQRRISPPGLLLAGTSAGPQEGGSEPRDDQGPARGVEVSEVERVSLALVCYYLAWLWIYSLRRA
jgi:hypothetical protein